MKRGNKRDYVNCVSNNNNCAFNIGGNKYSNAICTINHSSTIGGTGNALFGAICTPYSGTKTNCFCIDDNGLGSYSIVNYPNWVSDSTADKIIK